MLLGSKSVFMKLLSSVVPASSRLVTVGTELGSFFCHPERKELTYVLREFEPTSGNL